MVDGTATEITNLPVWDEVTVPRTVPSRSTVIRTEGVNPFPLALTVWVGTAVAGVWAGVGTGLLYGVAALAIKALSGILVRHETVANIVIAVVTSPYLYVLGGSLAIAMLLFQAALQAGRASIVVPVSNVTGSVYFIIAGTWLFHEHLPASPGRLGLRLAGIALAVLVLVVLGRQAPEPVPALVTADPVMASTEELAAQELAEVRR